jgi:hypothetical protein
MTEERANERDGGLLHMLLPMWRTRTRANACARAVLLLDARAPGDTRTYPRARVTRR